MKHKIVILIFLVFCGCTYTNAHQPVFKFRNGDLLFQDLDCGDLCDAIEKVTTGYQGLKFSHIGLVHINSDSQVYIIEAIGSKVQETKLEEFLNRSHDSVGLPKVIVARFKNEKMYAVADSAVAIALKEKGVDYDDAFLPDNNKWYCSELLAYSFNKAAGNIIFPNYPMTFIDPDTKKYFPAWVTYYQALGIAIPEGKPGCNPGSVLQSPLLKIFFPYCKFSKNK